MTEAPKIKPCPFCGASDPSDVYVDRLQSDGRRWAVLCTATDCLVEGPHRATKREAIAAWNTRDDAEVQRLVAEARAEAFEEAAKEAQEAWEKWNDPEVTHGVQCDFTACADIAQRIRALSDAPPWQACPCTMINHDESCPAGYPSLLCGVCDGKGITTREKINALAAEMLKIASDVGEAEDPFAAWEAIAPRQVTPQEADVERMAIAMWQDEAARAGTNGIAARRTPTAWLDQAPELQEKWRRYAHAALRALANGGDSDAEQP